MTALKLLSSIGLGVLLTWLIGTTPINAQDSQCPLFGQSISSEQAQEQPSNQASTLGCGHLANTFYADPFHALVLNNTPQTIPGNSSTWYSFGYGGQNAMVTLRLLNGVRDGLLFDVYTPEQVTDWTQTQPIGRGTPLRIVCVVAGEDEEGGEEGGGEEGGGEGQDGGGGDEITNQGSRSGPGQRAIAAGPGKTPNGGNTPRNPDTTNGESCANDLTWTGGFKPNGIYYVRVTNSLSTATTYFLTIEGDRVTICDASAANPNPALYTGGQVCAPVGQPIVQVQIPPSSANEVENANQEVSEEGEGAED